MSSNDPSLRLRPWASLVLFLSAYSPLLLILIIKDYDPTHLTCLPRSPVLSGILLLVAVLSSIATLRSVKEISGGLQVTVTKASNKSGDMFGYTVPYMLSFLRVDLGDWQTIISLLIFLLILFVMAYTPYGGDIRVSDRFGVDIERELFCLVTFAGRVSCVKARDESVF